jgi:hypothetical protein
LVLGVAVGSGRRSVERRSDQETVESSATANDDTKQLVRCALLSRNIVQAQERQIDALHKYRDMKKPDGVDDLDALMNYANLPTIGDSINALTRLTRVLYDLEQFASRLGT